MRPVAVTVPRAGAEAPERQPQATASAAVPTRILARASTAGPAVVRPVVTVVAEAEEPDQPQHEQADVEDPEADHEHPSLGGHGGIVPPWQGLVPIGSSEPPAT